MFKGAIPVAIIAALGNGLQGWDNAAIAGSLLYIAPDFNLENAPQVVGSIVTASLIGSVLSTFVAGPLADAIGRRSLLLVAAVLYIIGAFIDAWSPTVNVLIGGRSLVGFSIGLVATIAPLFIAECSPSDIRGQLATLPQLLGIAGMLAAYCFVFGVSLVEVPNWRFMLGVELLPALFYLLLLLFVLPESPRWLVSKGRMKEARSTLQHLRNQEDVAGELSMLVEGLGVGGDATLEEWLLKPSESIRAEDTADEIQPGQLTLIGSEGEVWIAQPLIPEGTEEVEAAGKEEEGVKGAGEEDEEKEETNLIRSLSQMASNSLQVNQLVSLMNEIQSAKEGAGGGEQEPAWMHEGEGGDLENRMVAGDFGESTLFHPLLAKFKSSPHGTPRRTPPISPLTSRQSSNRETPHLLQSSVTGSQMAEGPTAHLVGSMRTDSGQSFGRSHSQGGEVGWQLAWDGGQEKGVGGVKAAEEGLRRVFLLQEGGRGDPDNLNTLAMNGSSAAGEADIHQAQVLVTHPHQQGKEFLPKNVAGPVMVHPSKTAVRGPAWREILEPGVPQALLVGVCLQALQQACGINAVLYYTPTILMDSGAGMLEQLGLSGPSSSILASTATTFLMLPCIFLAMWLMDRSGRRALLLSTIPVMTLSLALLSVANILLPDGSLLQSIGSLSGVAIFSCSFVTGFGPIPNIICSEIFPTRVRGVCIGLCAATMWGCNIAVSQAFPILQGLFGLGGVFGLFCVMTVISWAFIYFQVPETKGLPLEFISEIFAMSAHAKEEGVEEHEEKY